jgi:ATP-dependent exoDNAse (exonuclease V) beta subunit
METLEPRIRSALRRAGVARADLDVACERTLQALRNTLADDRGQWLLSAAHEESGIELALTTGDGERFANHVVDRTFVSADGTRWIVDYKTSTHEGSNIDAFLASEADRYRAQLRRYRDAFAKLENRAIKTALYFPLLQKFHEVDCDVSE